MSVIPRTLGKISSVLSVVFTVTGNPILGAAFAANAALMSIVAPPKKPGVPGNATDITIGSDMLTPYPMGRTYASLGMVHDVGYGGKVNGVDNPYQSWVFVIGGGGPIQNIEAIQADFTSITFDATSGGMPAGEATGYYENFLWADSQLGACPESTALSGPFGAIPAWGSSYKLSGHPAFLLTAKWDKKGKKYASGVPQWGAVVNGVLVYDQRQDSTYPGGSGACRALDETTYVGSDAAENPSCHAVTYALGRWQGTAGPDSGPRKVMGCGFTVDAIDWPAWTEFANVCDANEWKIGGSVFEPGNRWDNLKRICAAGGGTPVWTGGLLSVLFPRPRVALDTISRNDLADGEIRIPAMKGWEQRLNGIVPKYPSEQNRWQMVQSDLVSVSTYVDEDGGEDKHEERPYELVPYKDQAAQLAAYELIRGRQIAGITFPCKPRLMSYKIGDALETDADLEDDLGLAAGTLLVITGRSRDPATCTVTLTFETELTTAEHDFALGRTGTAPPSPTLPTPEDMDDSASGDPPDAPDAGDWDIAGTSLSSAGGAIPAIVMTGGPADRDGLTGIQFDYRTSASYLIRAGEAAGWVLRADGGRVLLADSAPGEWINAMLDAMPEGSSPIIKEIVSVTPGTTYEASIRYQNKAGLSERLILGPVEVGVLIPAESVAVGNYDQAALDDMLARIAALE